MGRLGARCGLAAALVGMLWLAAQAHAAAPPQVELAFDPALRPMVRTAIAQAQRDIAVEVFKITDRGVIQDLIQASRRGVRVRVILCPSQTSNRRAARQLLAAGVQVRWYPLRDKNQLMHMKMAVFEERLLLFGSPNWTYWGLTLHHEGLMRIRQSDVVQAALANFEADWARCISAES